MKTYGKSPIIHHPQGFDYQVAYLSPARTLRYSKLLWMRWRK